MSTHAAILAEPLVIACFKWSTPGYRSTFGPAAVDTLRRMVRRHYQRPHRFVLFTDDARGLEETDIEVYELWDLLASVPNPSGDRNPSCYRRLRLFARDVPEWLGARIVWLDLDAVIVGDMRPVWDRAEDFVIWGDSMVKTQPYNGSMCMFTAGSRPQLWETFDPYSSPKLSRSMGFFGSDQGWIAACCPGEATWKKKDGVYSFRNHIVQSPRVLPADARIVFFHGRFDPWMPETQAMAPWVRLHYK